MSERQRHDANKYDLENIRNKATVPPGTQVVFWNSMPIRVQEAFGGVWPT